jgi:hypothetical protein
MGGAPACYGSSLGSNPNISKKSTKWATLAKEWPTPSSPLKKYKILKKILNISKAYLDILSTRTAFSRLFFIRSLQMEMEITIHTYLCIKGRTNMREKKAKLMVFS